VFTATVMAENSVSTAMSETVVLVVEPIAGLTATNDSPTALGNMTTFTAIITAGSGVSYTWDFGDGLGGTGPMVTHTYTATGVYTAVVTATNIFNTQVATTTVTVVEGFYIYMPAVVGKPE
jgi:PKD repeat protein